MKTTRANLTYILVLMISLVIFVSSIYQYRTQRQVFIEQSKERVSARVDLLASELTTMFSDAARDLFILRDLPQLISHINAFDAEERERKRQEIEEMFNVISLNKEIYDQIRFINRRGLEIVRVDNHGKGPVQIPQWSLQDKSNRYYFMESMKIGFGEIYVSQMDLNIERGEIEKPYKPIIRYATPVVDYMGRKMGIVILNVKADYMLNIIRERQRDAEDGEEFYLLNRAGFYLVHPDRKKEWGFMLGNKHALSKDNPRLMPLLNNGDKGKAMLLNENLKKEIFYVFNRVYPYVEMPALKKKNIATIERVAGRKEGNETVTDGSVNKCPGGLCWTLLYSTYAGALNPSFKEITFGMGLFFGGLLVTAVVISSIFAWRQSRPIQALSIAASKIADGDFSVRADIQSDDEIGRLGKVFNEMAENLQKRQKQEERFQRRLQKETVLAQEQERRSLAQDMHDQLGHSLAIANMKMQAAKSKLPAHAGEIKGSLDDGIKLVKEMIQQTRSLIFDLYPVMLDDFGIVRTIEQHVQDYYSKTGIKTVFSVKGDPDEPDRSVSLYLFRAVKELLNNALKYAEAGEIKVTVHGSDEIFGVTVEDNGRGFDASSFLRSSPDSKGIGLFSIRERVKRLGGIFTLDSSPGAGTRVRVEMPARKE